MDLRSTRNRRLVAVIASALLVVGMTPSLSGSQAPPRSPDSSPANGRSGFLDSIAAFLGLHEANPTASRPANVALDVVGVPRHDPIPAGVRWPEVKRVKELTGKRTANAAFWQLADGRVQTKVSPTQRFY